MRRYAAVNAAGQLVGYGAIWHERHGMSRGKFRMDLAVGAAWRGRGVERQLWEQLHADLRALAATTVQARVSERHEELLAFLSEQGFAETQRMVRLELAPIAAPREEWSHADDLLGRLGVGVTTLAAERAQDADYGRKWWEVENATRLDWPDPDPGPREPFTVEDAMQRLTDPGLVSDALFFAERDDAYVGYSGLATVEGDLTSLASWGTAVRPEWRRQGIATALKVRTIRYAKEHGCRRLVTHTASPAMLSINERLGFRRMSAEVRLVMTLTRPPAFSLS